MGIPHRRLSSHIRVAFARFFVVVYVVAGIFAVLHQDHRGDSGTNLGSAGARLSATDRASFQSHKNADLIAGSDRYCALCDFVSHMVSTAHPPQVACSLHAVLLGVTSPIARPQPRSPQRFYSRSASRAPPVA